MVTATGRAAHATLVYFHCKRGVGGGGGAQSGKEVGPSITSRQGGGQYSQAVATGGAQVQSLTPTPPPPLGGQNVSKVPIIAQYGDVGWLHRHQKLLVPRLKGLVKQVTPCVHTQNEHFLGEFSLAPKKAGFLQPLLILSPCWGSLRRQGLCSHFDPSPLWGCRRVDAILINLHHGDPKKAGVM